MDITGILQEVLTYIDEHLKEELNVEVLSAHAGFSSWHFCRLFQWSVGYPVMHYVRNRRLTFAAHELTTGRKILDIALEYGFETHSGFSKAFRRYYGCPPESYRRHANSERPSPPSLPRMKKYLNGGIIMEPKFVTRPAVKIAGYALKTKSEGGENNRSIPAFWAAYMNDGRVNRLHGESFVKEHAEYGACFPENLDTGEFDYVIGVEVKDGAVIPEGYHVCEIPAATYAVFSTPPSDAAGFSPAIQGTWQFLFNEWFPASGYEYAPGCVDYEYYDERCMTEKAKVCDICIPVVKKGN